MSTKKKNELTIKKEKFIENNKESRCHDSIQQRIYIVIITKK